jgi:hypothetical protein
VTSEAGCLIVQVLYSSPEQFLRGEDFFSKLFAFRAFHTCQSNVRKESIGVYLVRKGERTPNDPRCFLLPNTHSYPEHGPNNGGTGTVREDVIVCLKGSGEECSSCAD